MFAGASLPAERPKEWRSNSYHNAARSPQNSPSVSRRGSVSSVNSIRTDPGVFSDHSRQSSATSADSAKPQKSGLKSLFSRRGKNPKEKRDVEKLVLTSKHAAAVKTRMMMDPRYKDRKPVKTAEIVSSVQTGHLTAAQQEARHPHSGPPALHAKTEMPLLTRIVSGDEHDEEDEFEKMERQRLEWEMAKFSPFARIGEHESDSSAQSSARQSIDGDCITPPPREITLSPSVEKALFGAEPRRPRLVAKNSYGGRFHKDERGHWKR